MFRAVWNGAVLAESDRTVKAEGNHYFPPESLRREYFTGSAATSSCPRKGQARYYDVQVDGETSRRAAWYYPRPHPAAGSIAGHVAFWRGVRVELVPRPAEETPGSAARGLAGRFLARRRTGVLAARVPVLRDVAAGPARHAGASRADQHLGRSRRRRPGAGHHRRL
jgi:uncharacterized protein (DUF427 family)